MNVSIFKNPATKTRTRCAVCQRELGTPLIELPRLPITDTYVRERPREEVGYVDQAFHLCPECGHGQLSTMISPEVLYGYAYPFRTSAMGGARKANDFFVSFINRTAGNKQFKVILEIGCNDLYLLNCLRPRAEKLVGIDPILKGREAELSDDKIRVIGDLFENVDLGSLDDALIINSHFLEHVREPRSVIEKILDKSNNTLFIFQFPILDYLVSECRFDQIYHHHLHYFSFHSFVYLLSELGCELIDTEVNFHYWGTLLVAFRKSENRNANPAGVTPERVLRNYNIFKKRMSGANEYLKSLKGERLIGYGAGLQLPVVAYHLSNDFASFDCIVDDDKNKNGMFYINLPVPVRSPAVINSWEDINVLITAVGFSRAILGKLIPLNPKRIIVPLNV